MLKLWEEEPGGKQKPRRNFFKSLKLRCRIEVGEIEVKDKRNCLATHLPDDTSGNTWRIDRVKVDYITKSKTHPLPFQPFTVRQHDKLHAVFSCPVHSVQVSIAFNHVAI